MTEQDLDREHADLLLAEKRTSKRFDDAAKVRTDTIDALKKLCVPAEGLFIDGEGCIANEFGDATMSWKQIEDAIRTAHELNVELKSIRVRISRFA